MIAQLIISIVRILLCDDIEEDGPLIGEELPPVLAVDVAIVRRRLIIFEAAVAVDGDTQVDNQDTTLL